MPEEFRQMAYYKNRAITRDTCKEYGLGIVWRNS